MSFPELWIWLLRTLSALALLFSIVMAAKKDASMALAMAAISIAAALVVR